MGAALGDGGLYPARLAMGGGAGYGTGLYIAFFCKTRWFSAIIFYFFNFFEGVAQNPPVHTYWPS